MLAYGRSKRTLRFSCQEQLGLDSLSYTNQLRPVGLFSWEQQLSRTSLDLPAAGEPEAELRSPASPRQSTNSPPPPSPRRALPDPAETVGFPSRVHSNEQLQAWKASMQNVDSYGRREAPIRKRFRLDMDIGGSDSDSSCEKDGLATAYASRREFADDYRQVASGMEASTGTPFGSSGRYLDDGIWTESCAKPPLVTPDHVESMEPPRPPFSRDPFAVSNPYQTAATITPENVRRKQGGAVAPSTVRSRRGSCAVGGGGGSGSTPVEGGASDLRRMPSPIAVRDVYPPELRRIWPFQNFNAVQSALHHTVATTDCNVIVSAPTGCGKTVVLEMAIARLLHESGMHLGNRKIIYIAPIKALCQQTLDDWTAKFAPLGIRLSELTSDSSSGSAKGSVSLRDLASADVILTTPEKWDSVTRRWKEHAFLVGTVALVLVDEVHTIGEERGATLEVILTRMKMVSRSKEVISMGLPASRMRIIALSATLPNAEDFGSFLGAEVFRFGDEYRPVSLQTHVLGYPAGNNPFLFDRGLNKHVSGILARYSNGKPALIFCGSKKDTETLAASLAQRTDYSRRGSQVVMQFLATAASKAEDPQLAKLVARGVAIHNSGLSPHDRGLVERTFLSGSLLVLVATTTLAMGVNLPARLVVVKGTNQYRGAMGYQELPRSAILQMMGRAGRPGFDSSGVAVVMTSQSNKNALERLSAGQEAVESSLQARLLEALNSEVCQGETIHDIGEAIDWLKSTFYFIRCKRNPAFYGLPAGLSDGGLYGHMQTTCLKGLKQLREAGVIGMDEDEFSVEPTPHGVLFSRFMVRFDSMKALMSVSENHGIRDILRVCAECDELNVPVRRAEKRALNELNKQVRFPPAKKEIIRTPADKALALLQAALGGLTLEDWTLRGEQSSMLDASARLLGCCAESLAAAGRGGGLGCAVSLQLMRSVRVKMWPDTELGQLTQLPGVGDTLSMRLAGSHVITLLDLARMPSAKVDTISGRKHPFGHGIRHAALQLLSRALTAGVSRHQLEGGREELEVQVGLAFQSTDPFADGYIEPPDDAFAPPPSGWRRHDTNFQLLVYYDPPTNDQGRGPASPLLLFRKVTGESTHTVVLPPDAVDNDRTIHLWLICSGVCGMDIADVRMKPSSLDDRVTSAEELQTKWTQNGRTSADGSGSYDEGDEVPASDRASWSDWEQSDHTPRAKRAGRAAGATGGGAKAKKSGSGGGKGKEKVKGRERVQGKGGARAGSSSSGGGRQLDLASSFKAGAQRALSDSARKRASAGVAAATAAAAGGGGGGPEGMSRGDLGGIGVSEAEDDLGVSQDSGVSKRRKAGGDTVGNGTTSWQQLKSTGRTWSSRGRGSGNVVAAASSEKGTGIGIGTYNPGGRAMRTVLRQKGSEMNLSARVGVDRLGRTGGNNNGSASSSTSPGTPRLLAEDWLPGGKSGGSGGGGSSSSHSSTRRSGGARHLPPASEEGDGDGAVVDLYSDSFGPLPGSPEVERLQHPQQSRRQQQQRQQQPQQQHIDISSFAHQSPSSSSSLRRQAAAVAATPSPGHPGTAYPAAMPQRQRQRQRQRQQQQQQAHQETVGGVYPVPSTARPAQAATAGGHAPGSSGPPAARSWDDISRQRGKGRHASVGVGRLMPTTDSVGMSTGQQGGGRGGHFGRSGGSGGLGARDLSPPAVSAGGARGGRDDGGTRGWGDGATTSSFFDGRETEAPALGVCQSPAPPRDSAAGPSYAFRRNAAEPKHDGSYAGTSSLRSSGSGSGNGKGYGNTGGLRASARSGALEGARTPNDSHEPPASVTPISIAVSQRRQTAPTPAARRAAPGATSTGAAGGGGGGGGVGNHESSMARTTATGKGHRHIVYGRPRGAEGRRGNSDSQEQRGGGSGGWFDPPPVGVERGSNNPAGGRLIAEPAHPHMRGTGARAGGGAGVPIGELPTGAGGGVSYVGQGDGRLGGESEVLAEGRGDVAKKLDFHAVFD